jgi:hypothetical protein
MGSGCESIADVSEQRQRNPPKNISDQLVRPEELQREDDAAEAHDEDRNRKRNEQIDRRGHAAKVRASLDGVADQHADQDRP